jgi:7-carboxy-7-deazaguanine synthase
MNTLVVNEIFTSIQGESSHAGRPCVFVRLTYCNLRCGYCDTQDAFTEGKEMSIGEVLDSVRASGPRLVEVTGGEPLLQPGVYELMRRICDEGFDCLLETSGSLDISRVDPRVKRIMDLKCPSSGMAERNRWKNIDQLKEGDELKFVIGTRGDYDWARQAMGEYSLTGRCPVLFSPSFGQLEPVRLAEWILEDRLDVRFQLQLHKLIWPSDRRGV